MNPQKKRSKEIIEEGRKLCSLPDSILVDIISRLDSTEEAFRTSILSKRWQYLWPLVSNLSFTYDYLKYDSIVDFFSLFDQTVTQCATHFNLNKFQLRTFFFELVKSKINECIRYAVRRNVQDLALTLWNGGHLDESFFTVSCFTKLKLSGVSVNTTCAISWKNLRSLCVSRAKLDEGLVQSILIGCPVLEILELKKCYGYKRLDVTSKSVKSLALSGYNKYTYVHDDIIEINAPYILSLTFRKCFHLWKVILLNVSSLVKANLNYRYYHEKTKKEQEDMLKGLIQSLSHVKDLTIGSFSFKVFYRLKAEGYIFPPNLKVADSDSMELNGWSDSDSDGSGDSEELWSDDGSEGDEVN